MLKFRGASNLSLDAKGRIVLPARYRERLAEICSSQLVVTVSNDLPCLLIYPLNEWEIVEEKINALPNYNKAVNRFQRKIIGFATDIEVNESGRLLLSSPLREYARLAKKVVLIGQGKKFELWDEQLLAEHYAEEDAGEEVPAALQELSL